MSTSLDKRRFNKANCFIVILVFLYFVLDLVRFGGFLYILRGDFELV